MPKPTPDGKRLDASPLSSGERKDVRVKRCVFPRLFSTTPEILARATRPREEMNGIQIGKGETKLFLLADDEIVEIPPKSTKKFLE